MPAEHRIDEVVGCVFSRVFGTLTDEECLHQSSLKADPAFRNDLNQRWDFRGVDGIQVTSETVRRLAASNPFGSGSRRAAIVDSPLAHGLVRMFAAYAGDTPDDVRVFEDPKEANESLGLASDVP
jgi:hypothetical protein